MYFLTKLQRNAKIVHMYKWEFTKGVKVNVDRYQSPRSAEYENDKYRKPVTIFKDQVVKSKFWERFMTEEEVIQKRKSQHQQDIEEE